MAEQHKIITPVFKNNPRNFKKQFFYSTFYRLIIFLGNLILF